MDEQFKKAQKPWAKLLNKVIYEIYCPVCAYHKLFIFSRPVRYQGHAYKEKNSKLELEVRLVSTAALCVCFENKKSHERERDRLVC